MGKPQAPFVPQWVLDAAQAKLDQVGPFTVHVAHEMWSREAYESWVRLKPVRDAIDMKMREWLRMSSDEDVERFRSLFAEMDPK